MPTRVLLADDHQIAREALRAILEGLPGVEVVATAADGREAVRLAAELTPDVVLMDLVMPGLNGIAATTEILRVNGGIKVIAISMHAESPFVERMQAAGAAGYILKNDVLEELACALRAVTAGGEYFNGHAT